LPMPQVHRPVPRARAGTHRKPDRTVVPLRYLGARGHSHDEPCPTCDLGHRQFPYP
jgi:hypothetical protein